jgi:toxin ParE1/3/4
MNRVSVSPRADKDIDEQFDYIAQDNLDAAVRFYAATHETFKILAGFPEMGTIREFKRINGLRMFPVVGFKKHLIFYRPMKLLGASPRGI